MLRSRLLPTVCFAFLALPLMNVSLATEETSFVTEPAAVELLGNFARAQLVVAEIIGGEKNSRSRDLTADAKFESSHANIVAVDDAGQLLAKADGSVTIKVTVGSITRETPVTVSGVVPAAEVTFNGHVVPILTKAGCAQGACHASQFGKGGFKLSVFGFDPPADHRAIVRDSIQRRFDRVDPANSLLLLKPTMQVPHGGGHRLKKDSVDYEILLSWLANGTPAPVSDAAKVTALQVFPSHRIATVGQNQQLRVEATYSDGSVRDVTAWAKFDTMDDAVLGVTSSGLVSVIGKGQAPLMVRFEGQAVVSMFVVPYSDSVELAGWKSHNFIDDLAAAKFRELGIEPSPLCDDATFVRRAYLDCIGGLPTVAETVAFIESTEADKREKLIDRLLGLTGDPALDIYNDRYAAFWTLKWSDLIRNNSNSLGEQGMWSLHNWIKESFRTNKPIDQFVRELVTAKGSIYMNGPANFFRINANSSALTEATTQLFLGIRLECAKCHHHPFETYSQADYYGMASFFARVGTKNSEEFGLFGREQVVVVRNSGDVNHPRTGKRMEPTPLSAEPIDHPLDRRIALAEWLTSPDNDLFARSVVNRYVGYLLGRGLVEPIDDMRSTNPPSNVEMMDALARDFVDSKFNLKHLIRTIMTSRLYQLDSAPTAANASDRRFYSHFKVKRLLAEPLLDAVDQVTGTSTKFKSLPPGTRAIELPDAEYPNYFLNTFAKPRRASVCECERPLDANLAQALHTLNGDILATKIADETGLIAKLTTTGNTHDEILEQIYLTALSRYPTAAERIAAHEFLDESPAPEEFYQDLLWALINSKQFLFNR